MSNHRFERLLAAGPQPTQLSIVMAEFRRLVSEDVTLQGMSRSARAGRARLLAELHEANGAGWIRAARNP